MSSAAGSGATFEQALNPERTSCDARSHPPRHTSRLGYGEPIVSIKFLGDIFLYLLKLIVRPLVFVSMAWTITTVRVYARLGNIFGGFFAHWLIMDTIAAVIGTSPIGSSRTNVLD